jgi:hypothetical protein
MISLSIDGQTVTVPAGSTVLAAVAIAAAVRTTAASPSASAPAERADSPSAALAMRAAARAAGAAVTRRSVSGMLRGPLCGMGVCHECRLTIDCRAHQLACQTQCAPNMQVRTALAEDAA